MVNDIIMPPIGMLLGGVDFTQMFLNLSGGENASLAAVREAGAATIDCSVFVNAVINLLIVAFAIFMVIKQMNKLKKIEEAAPEAPKAPPREGVLLEKNRFSEDEKLSGIRYSPIAAHPIPQSGGPRWGQSKFRDCVFLCLV